MTSWSDRLYELMPAVHQIRDGERGEPLRQLLAIIGEQADLLQQDIEGLYDNWFIETCDGWVVPYLADLVGYARVEGAGAAADPTTAQGRALNQMLFPRREIANLVRRRRRKGSLSVLENIAFDVASWKGRAVEFSRIVHGFQHCRFPDPSLGGVLDVRTANLGIRLNGPFDQTAHTVDVRQIQSRPGIGWAHPLKVGLFVWRRTTYPITRAQAFHRCTQRESPKCKLYTFDRLGFEQPLYLASSNETDEFALAEERHLPLRLRRHVLVSEEGPFASRQGNGATSLPKSFEVRIRYPQSGWDSLEASQLVVCDLTTRRSRETALDDIDKCQAKAAIDPEAGLILFPDAGLLDVKVTYQRVATGRIGGGGYKRSLAARSTWRTLRLRVDESEFALGPKDLFIAARDAASDFLRSSTEIPPLTMESVAPATPAASLTTSAAAALATSADASIGSGATPAAANDDAAPPQKTVVWSVTQNLSIELLDDASYKIAADIPLRITDGVTLEIRSTNGRWPLVSIEPASTHDCSRPWEVELGRSSRLVLDGLQLCGATVCVKSLSGMPSQALTPSCGCGSAAVAANGASEPEPKGQDSNEPPNLAAMTAEAPATVVVRHSTFVPGGRAPEAGCHCEPSHASISMALAGGRLAILNSIVGTLNVERIACGGPEGSRACPENPLQLQVADSIVHAARGRLAITGECCWPAHADLSVERSTVLGDVCVQQISRGEDCLFTGVVHVQRRSRGYLRFCYVPTCESDFCQPEHWEHREEAHRSLLRGWRRWMASLHMPVNVSCHCDLVRTPPRFKCIPSTSPRRSTGIPCVAACGFDESARAAGAPRFVTTAYGEAGYCELALDCPEAIRRGAEDESELGAFHDNYWPQRQAALEARFQEYTPADMQSAVIYADDLDRLPIRSRRRHKRRPFLESVDYVR